MIERFIQNRLNVFWFILIVIVYWFNTFDILNFKSTYSYVLYILSFNLVFLLEYFYAKNKKIKKLNYLNKNSFGTEKKRKLKEKHEVSYIIVILTSLLFGFVLYCFFMIFLNNFIIYKRNLNEMKTKKCEIFNYISGRNNAIHYYFNDKVYLFYYKNSNHLTREDIINNHYVIVEYCPSILGTYVVENYRLVKK